MKKYFILQTSLILAVNFFFSDIALSDELIEHELKAAFIYKFLNYIQYQETDSNSQHYRIGVYKSEHMLEHLKQLEEKEVRDKKIIVLNINKVSEFAEFNVVFVGNSELEITPEIYLEDVLTITDAMDKRSEKGIINLYIKDSKVRFEIDVKKAIKQNIKISSQLLKLADVYR